MEFREVERDVCKSGDGWWVSGDGGELTFVVQKDKSSIIKTNGFSEEQNFTLIGITAKWLRASVWRACVAARKARRPVSPWA